MSRALIPDWSLRHVLVMPVNLDCTDGDEALAMTAWLTSTYHLPKAWLVNSCQTLSMAPHLRERPVRLVR